MSNFIKVVGNLIPLAVALSQFGASTQSLLNDTSVTIALANADPPIQEAAARLSAEWRSVENDVNNAEHGSIWGKLSAVFSIAGDAEKLFNDAVSVFEDPTVVAALEASPLAADFITFKAEIATIKADLQAIA